MYVKLFSKILDSSIWLEPPATCKVWITLLAAKDRTGFARFASVKNLAHRAFVSVEETEEALRCLTSPDPDSSNPDYEGRRIEKVPGGYMILNSDLYRDLKNQYSQKELDRERAARYRDKKRHENVTDRDSNVTHRNSSVSVSVSESINSSTKNEKRSRARGTLEEVMEYCASLGMPASDGEWFFSKCEGCGWKNNKEPIVDWKRTFSAWKLNGYLPSQKNGQHKETEEQRIERIARKMRDAKRH